MGQGLAVRARWPTPARAARSSSSTTRATRSSATSSPTLAEEPGDRLAEGRRHQRADREAGAHLREAARSSDASSDTLTGHLPWPTRRGRTSVRTSRRGRLRTEFAFVLPRGYVDSSGTVHRDGVMRLATARDELVPLRDDRVRENPAYLTVVLLGRVVIQPRQHRRRPRRHHREPVRLRPGVPAGPVPPDQPGGHTTRGVTCPDCSNEFAVDLAGGRLGES